LFDLVYRDLGSRVHRLGVGAKIALFGSLGILSLAFSDLAFLLAIVCLCLSLAHQGRVSSRAWAFLKPFLAFSLVVFAINLIANQNGDNVIYRTTLRFYWTRINFQLTLESLSLSLRMVLRLLSLVLVFVVFTLTTKPEIILTGLSAIRGMESFGLLLALSYRFLPTLALDGTRIKDSLQSRGIVFDEGKRIDRARAYASLGIPLVANSLDRSLQLAEALESRGYGMASRRPRRGISRLLHPSLAAIYYLSVSSAFLALWLLAGVGRAVLFTEASHLPSVLPFIVLYLLPTMWGVSE